MSYVYTVLYIYKADVDVDLYPSGHSPPRHKVTKRKILVKKVKNKKVSKRSQILLKASNWNTIKDEIAPVLLCNMWEDLSFYPSLRAKEKI